MSTRVKFFLGLLGFTFVVRLLPYVLTPNVLPFLSSYDVKVDPNIINYPWNFVPLTAACLFGGAYFSDRRFSFGLPLLAVFASDLSIALVTGRIELGFPQDRWSAYLCYPIIVMLGSGLGRRTWPLRGLDALGRGILAEIVFFVVTNFAYFLSQTDLPHNGAGLIACYIAAIPFAGKSFASTAFFSVLLFSPLAVRAAGESTSTAPVSFKLTATGGSSLRAPAP